MPTARPLNAFESVPPRATPDTHNPPKKRGPKSTKGSGLVLNVRGKPQAPLRQRADCGISFAAPGADKLAADKRFGMRKAAI